MRLRLLPTRATFFDTPARTHYVTRADQVARLDEVPLAAALLDGVGTPAALLNADREIVMANELLAVCAGVPRAHLIGRRIGEVLGCVNAFEPPNGCGTTEACAWCGAAQALRESRTTWQPVTGECRIAVAPDHTSDAVNAALACTPLDINGVPVVMLAFRDTSDTERRLSLEHMFFGAARHVADGLRDLIEAWPRLALEEANNLAPATSRLARQLIEAIDGHRDLVAAESGTLVVKLAPVDPRDLLESLCAEYRSQEAADGKALQCEVARIVSPAVSDAVLLRRVIGHLVLNALEASACGDTVTVRHRAAAGAAVFEVHNPGVMSPGARLQVFQRGFTTRGRGRGLGTYSAKLIAERHLGGTLEFLSAPSLGTTFTLHLSA